MSSDFEQDNKRRRAWRLEDLGHLSEANAALIDSFKRALRVRRVSSKTVEAYARDIEQLARTFAHGDNPEPGHTPLTEITGPALHEWFVDMSEGGPGEPEWRPATQKRKVSAIRQFYKWLIVTRGFEIPDPSHHLPNIKGDPIVTHFLEAEEVAAVFDHLAERAEPHSPVYDGLPQEEREKQALLHTIDLIVTGLCYWRGLRISEVVEMGLANLTVEPSGDITIYTRGKGNTFFPLEVHPDVTPYLHRYLEQRKRLSIRGMGDGQYLFIYPPTGKRLTRQIAFRRLRNACSSALGERGKAVSPHWLRHSLATHLNDEGWDIRSIQETLRHRTIMTTQRYVKARTDVIDQALRSRDLKTAAQKRKERFGK